MSAVALDSSVLTNGSNKALARVKVTADAAGDLSWDKIAFKIQKTAAITLGATSTIALWNGSNQIAGNFATVTGDLLGGLEAFPVTGGSVSTTDLNLVFLPTAEQTVPAGTSLTYELRGTVGGNAAGASIDVAIANPTTSASTNTAASIGVTAVATPTFTWSDKSSVSAVHSTGSSDWTNDYLVKALPLTVGNVVSAL